MRIVSVAEMKIVKEFASGSIARSLLFSGLLLLLPLLVAVVYLGGQAHKTITLTEDNLHSIQLLPELYQTIEQLGRYRGLREIARSQEGSAHPLHTALNALSTQIGQMLQQLAWQVDQLPAGSFARGDEELERVIALWQQGEESPLNFVQLSDLIAHLNSIALHTLPYGQDGVHLLVEGIPHFKEILAQLRGYGAGYLSCAQHRSDRMQSCDERYRNPVQRQLWSVRDGFTQLRNLLDAYQDQLGGIERSILFEIVNDLQQVRDLVEWEILDADQVRYNPEGYFAQASKPIEALNLLSIEILQQIEQRLRDQLQSQYQKIFTASLLLLISLVVAAGLAVRNGHRWVMQIQRGVSLLERLGAGDFNQSIPTDGQGEFSQLMVALDRTQQQLQQSHQAKDDFLASMSHELRTPLASIIGNAKHLEESGMCGSRHCPQTDAWQVLRSITYAHWCPNV